MWGHKRRESRGLQVLDMPNTIGLSPKPFVSKVRPVEWLPVVHRPPKSKEKTLRQLKM